MKSSDKKTPKDSEVIEEKIEKIEKTRRSKVINLSSSESEEEVKPIKAKRVQSQAQKDAFERARVKRAEQIAIRKEVKDKEDLKFNEYKNAMKLKKDAKVLKKKEAELKEYDSSSEESVIVVKKKKSKQKKVVYISDDEEEKKPINIVINNAPPVVPIKKLPLFL
jgi:hypothetical protein